MMRQTLIETIVDAIQEEAEWTGEWKPGDPLRIDGAVDPARILDRVLAALREPGEGVWREGATSDNGCGGSLGALSAVECWQAMIDAAGRE